MMLLDEISLAIQTGKSEHVYTMKSFCITNLMSKMTHKWYLMESFLLFLGNTKDSLMIWSWSVQ